MKRVFVTIIILMIVTTIVPQKAINNHSFKKYDLVNTHWVSKIENCCSNYYDFKEHGSYIFYSGELDDYSPGVYSIKKDTLFLHEFYSDEDDPYEILNEDVRFVALICGNSFQLLYREDIIRTGNGEFKWIRKKLDKQTYKKMSSSGRPISEDCRY